MHGAQCITEPRARDADPDADREHPPRRRQLRHCSRLPPAAASRRRRSRSQRRVDARGSCAFPRDQHHVPQGPRRKVLVGVHHRHHAALAIRGVESIDDHHVPGGRHRVLHEALSIGDVKQPKASCAATRLCRMPHGTRRPARYFTLLPARAGRARSCARACRRTDRGLGRRSVRSGRCRPNRAHARDSGHPSRWGARRAPAASCP
jgi:hypothetical protein